MSTIRPLATIAILAGLGVFLAQQINKPGEDAGQLTAGSWGEAPSFETPGAATATPPASAAVATPPLEAPPFAAPPVTAQAAATAETASLPPLPALPTEAGQPTQSPAVAQQNLAPPASQALTPPLTDDIPMPDDVAEADYDGVPNDPLAGMAPPVPAATQPAPPTTAPAGVTTDPYQSYAPTAEADTTAPAYPGEEPAYAPLGQLTGSAEPSFADALPAINQALQRNELTRAHALLSSWYGDPTLTDDQRAKVDELLSQLAGTVVYSTEHRLEPAYTVKPGDTLKTIAQQYQVPWRLLAKINGVPTAEDIQVGQTLKVIRGPFGAVVDAASSELILMIDGKYAGKFPVQLSGAAQAEGQWRVTQKPAGAASPYGAAAEKQLLLTDAGGMATLVIGTNGGSPMERGRVAVAPSDLDELHDILSVGSEITIRK